MDITVITPTIRPDGLPLVQKALRRQTKEHEWLIGSSFDPGMGEWVKDDFKGGFWTLNRIYNRLVSQAKGELIVSWQDYTFARPDALEKYWTHYQQDKQALVSGIGDKYTDETWRVVEWRDPRRKWEKSSFQPVAFSEVEGNFSAVPKEAFYSVGGFDEELDFKGYGMDFFGVLDRLHIQGGWGFFIDFTNESFSIQHGRVKDWEEKNLMHGIYENRRLKYIENPKLSYLK
jgi:hypothetical protein